QHGTVVINADGTVTYTPNAGYSGTDSYTYIESDGHGGTATGTVNVTVIPALVMTPMTLASTTVGSTYSQAITVSLGTPPYSRRVISGALPGGLFYDPATSFITGTATQSGTFTFTIQAQDSSVPPLTLTRTYSITVGPPVVTTTFLPNAVIGTSYSQ